MLIFSRKPSRLSQYIQNPALQKDQGDFDVNVSDYINNIRLEQARSMLQNPELTISEVAYKNGSHHQIIFQLYLRISLDCRRTLSGKVWVRSSLVTIFLKPILYL